MGAYKCACNINHGENLRFIEGQLISQEEYDKLPEKIKFKFQKLGANLKHMSDLDVRKILLELKERVENIEAKLSKK